MITSKQRAYLRGLANELQPVLYVGKEGITPGTIQQIEEDLEAHELIKGCVQPNCPMEAREVLSALCEECQAEPVQAIGRRFCLYRPAKEKPTIVLPS